MPLLLLALDWHQRGYLLVLAALLAAGADAEWLVAHVVAGAREAGRVLEARL